MFSQIFFPHFILHIDQYLFVLILYSIDLIVYMIFLKIVYLLIPCITCGLPMRYLSDCYRFFYLIMEGISS